MRFVVEKARSRVPPTEWEEVGVADHAGTGSPGRAVEELATETGKYRVRPEVDPEATFEWFAVGTDGAAQRVDAL